MLLADHIKKLIRQNGPITIAQFMQIALSDPRHGYYMKKDPFGKDGDFTTAPEISQMFGELIGAWVANYWILLGKPNLQIIETGPGRGTLMADLLRATRNFPAFHDSIEIKLMEISPILKKKQNSTLEQYEDKISWIDSLSDIEHKPTIFIANEFFDALPVHQFIKTDKGWAERMVGLQNDQLVFVSNNISPITAQIDLEHPNTKRSDILETSPASASIIKQMASLIEQNNGAALIIDYGYTENNYNDSLQALKSHNYSNILDNIGNSDITTLVDFNQLIQAIDKYNINCNPITSQKQFLNSLGIQERAKILSTNASDEQKDDISSAVHRLTNEEEMGDLFKVMIIDKVN